jgi:hypothetical protein
MDLTPKGKHSASPILRLSLDPLDEASAVSVAEFAADEVLASVLVARLVFAVECVVVAVVVEVVTLGVAPMGVNKELVTTAELTETE